MTGRFSFLKRKGFEPEKRFKAANESLAGIYSEDDECA
jgi:hypothetical protein